VAVVAELHVAAVRALLEHDIDAHLRLVLQVDRDGSVEPYGLFYKVVFEQAVRRSFGPAATRGDVIRFVARARTKHPPDVDDVDTLTAERLLRAMLGDEDALRALTDQDEALIAPLLLELADTLDADELLAEAGERTDQIERELLI
jgi:hypothetical protein